MRHPCASTAPLSQRRRHAHALRSHLCSQRHAHVVTLRVQKGGGHAHAPWSQRSARNAVHTAQRSARSAVHTAQRTQRHLMCRVVPLTALRLPTCSSTQLANEPPHASLRLLAARRRCSCLRVPFRPTPNGSRRHGRRHARRLHRPRRSGHGRRAARHHQRLDRQRRQVHHRPRRVRLVDEHRRLRHPLPSTRSTTASARTSRRRFSRSCSRPRRCRRRRLRARRAQARRRARGARRAAATRRSTCGSTGPTTSTCRSSTSWS